MVKDEDMFVTDQLNLVTRLIKTHDLSPKIYDFLQSKYTNLEAVLLRAKILRGVSKKQVSYICQSKILEQSQNFGYLFAPLILANLNQQVIYHTQASESVFSFLNQYYQVEAKQYLRVEQALENIKMYINLDHNFIDQSEYIYFSLIEALCRADVTQVFLITKLEIDQDKLNELSNFLNVQIHMIFESDVKMIKSSELDLQQLFFKRKNQAYISLCRQFAELNAQIVQFHSFDLNQSINLIEDMFYSEQIFEKLSVYAEYIQTKIQNSALYI